MKKRSLLLCLAVVLSLTAAIGGTLAYLTDTETATNVMVVGNVDIEQYEQKRTDQANDSFVGLIDYTDGEPLYPAVYDDALLAAEESTGLWTSGEITGALDKIVSVKNVGASDAYYRTIFAFEKIAEDMLLINKNTMDYTWEKVAGDVEVDGVTYTLWVATPVQPILAAKATSPYSLYQVAMSKDADNEVVKAVGSEYNILVASQAVQTQNFSDAATAFSTAFAGQVTAENNPWKNNSEDNEDAVETIPVVYIHTVEDMKAFAADVNSGNDYKGTIVKLTNDLDLQNEEWQPIGYNAINADGTQTSPKVNHYFRGTFDGQGHTISNLNVTQEYTELWKNCRGLFGQVENAAIRNLNIHNAEVSGYSYSAVLVGYGKGISSFENIKVTGHVTVNVQSSNGAGVVGGAGISRIENVTVQVDETSYVKCDQTWRAEDDGTIDYVGGVFAQCWPTTAKNITSNIDVIGTYTAVGGIGGGAPKYSENIVCTGDVTVLKQDMDRIANADTNDFGWKGNGLIYGYSANENSTHAYCTATGVLTINGQTGADVNGMGNGNRFGAPRFGSSVVTIID